MLQELETQNDGQIIRMAYEFQLAVISNSGLSKESLDKTQVEIKELFKDYEGVLRPWLGRRREDRKNSLAKDFKEQWKNATGVDLSDPVAVAEWENRLDKEMQKSNEAHLASIRESEAIREKIARQAQEVIEKRRRGRK